METINDRMELIVNQLFSGNKAAFAKAIGFPPTGLSSYLSKQRRSKPSVDMVSKIVTLLGVDARWLLTGEGGMQAGEAEAESCGAAAGCHTIMYYPNVEASMGDVGFPDAPDETAQAMVLPGFDDCTMAVNAWGDSMAPLIGSGQIVLLKEWTERFIDWGRIYLVVTRSGHRAIKRLHPGSDAAHIECRSENAEANPPFEVELADVVRLYIVKGWIARDVT